MAQRKMYNTTLDADLIREIKKEPPSNASVE
jgi:hypothetical protein